MTDINIKKEEIKYLLEGKPPRPANLEEAKKRLKETDPGVDIKEILKFVNNPTKENLISVLIDILTDPKILSYFSPVIKDIIKILLKNA